MGEALFELEQNLRSSREKLTSQEANVLMNCKAKALKDFTIGSSVGAGVMWLATRSMSNLYRINLAGGAAALSGLLRFGQSLDSCIESILGMDGSRMQLELANIMLKKYPNDPITTKLIPKLFYCENVFDDSTSGIPKLRWRFRNTFYDNYVAPQKPQGTIFGESFGDDIDSEPKQVSKPQHTRRDSSTDKTYSEPLRVSVNNVNVAMSNPFDCIFGAPETDDESQRLPTSTTIPTKHTRKQKRSQRRHRTHAQKVPARSS